MKRQKRARARESPTISFHCVLKSILRFTWLPSNFDRSSFLCAKVVRNRISIAFDCYHLHAHAQFITRPIRSKWLFSCIARIGDWFCFAGRMFLVSLDGIWFASSAV